ncbi:hypothetical protein ACVIJ6_006328 [Bradyrhizobium sp. USDA 4369]
MTRPRDQRWATLRQSLATVAVLVGLVASAADARPTAPLPDLRSDFVRQCAPHMVGRWAHPEAVCSCLHDHAVVMVEDADLREALLRGISENGVPTIETQWVPPSKLAEIGPTFSKIAKPTLQCMFAPAD